VAVKRRSGLRLRWVIQRRTIAPPGRPTEVTEEVGAAAYVKVVISRMLLSVCSLLHSPEWKWRYHKRTMLISERPVPD
jgi:hypothetical protein